MKNRNEKLSVIQALFAVVTLWFLVAIPVRAQQSDVDAVLERAAAAGIDHSQLEQIRERGELRGLDNETLSGLVEPLADLAERGLPSEFMMQKILEGLSKGVPPGRMSPVILSIHQHTPAAVSISDDWLQRAEVAPFLQSIGGRESRFREDLVRASLKSLTQQVPQNTIESLLDELGDPAVLEKTSLQVVPAAVGILPDMPASMLNEAGTQAVISHAVRGGFSPADIQKLPGAMNAAERRSQLGAASILDGVSNQLGSGIPANQVLQNLFNGNINAGPPADIPGRPNNRPGGRPDKGQGQGQGNGGPP